MSNQKPQQQAPQQQVPQLSTLQQVQQRLMEVRSTMYNLQKEEVTLINMERALIQQQQEFADQAAAEAAKNKEDSAPSEAAVVTAPANTQRGSNKPK